MFRKVESYIKANNLVNEEEFWPLLKYQLTRRQTLNNDTNGMEYKSTSYLRIFLAILISLVNLSKTIFKNKKSAFFGASTRAQITELGVRDEFLNNEVLKNSHCLYHCSNLEAVNLYYAFKHGVIFENLVVKVFSFIVSKKYYQDKYNGYFSLDFLTLLNKEFNLCEKEVYDLFINYEIKRKIYSAIIKFLKVNHCTIISSYTKPAIVSAANNLQNNTVEYQHGLLAPYHSSYQYSSDTVWKSTLLPKKIILNSSFWEKNMTKSCFIKESQIEVMEPKPYSTDQEKNELKYYLGDKKYVVFTGQGICYESIVNLVIDFLDVNPGVYFIYRPHPREYKNYNQIVEGVNNSGLIIVDRNIIQNTNCLIESAMAHFSIYSSCHFEAIDILGKTYVFDVLENNIMRLGGVNESIVYFNSIKNLKKFKV